MNRSTDEHGIRAAITFYIEGMRTGNVEVLRQGFHQQAILCGYLRDEIIPAPIKGLYDWVNANPAPVTTGEAFDCVVLSLEISGRVASAKVRETHEGAVIDYFHLLKHGDR
jgi:Putative lumazine-binding